MLEGRRSYIDVAKGIGIICAVIGHIIRDNYSTQIIFLFHMPLFFFLSGLLFKPKAEIVTFGIYKFKQLIIPYIFYLIPIYALQEVIYFTDHPLTTKALGQAFFAALYGGRALGGFTSVFWFVPCMYAVLMFMNYLAQEKAGKSLLIITILSYVISFLNQYYCPTLKIPYDLNAVFGIIPIFYISYKSAYEKNRSLNLALISISCFGIILIFCGIPNHYDIKNSYYGLPIITLLTSVSTVMLLVILCRQFENAVEMKYAVKILSEFGKASLVIMYLHMPLQILCGSYLTKNSLVKVLFALIASLILYYLFRRYRISRALLLGSVVDFDQILGQFSNRQDVGIQLFKPNEVNAHK